MPWGPGGSVTAGAIATNIRFLYVFGSTDSGKNLVTGTSVAATLNGSAAYGSDSIGTYVENTSSAGRLVLSTSSGSSFPSGDYSYFITFSREGTISDWAALFLYANGSGSEQNALQRSSNSTTQARSWYNGGNQLGAFDLATMSLSTEYSFVVTFSGTTMKLFKTGGTSAVTFGTATNTRSGTVGQIHIGGWPSGEWYLGRFRAYGEWGRALSDAEAQSMADNPQQIITPAVTYTYARPSSDVTTQWTPSTPAAPHYSMIDETTASDADYIYATAAGQTDEVKLAAMTAPQAGTDLLINYRVQGIVGSASVTLSLVCGTTVIATDTARTFNGDYTLNVPSATWSPAVTDWTNMRLRFVSA